MGQRKIATWIMLHPLVVVATLFIAGLNIGRATQWPLPLTIATILLSLLLWAISELLHRPKLSCIYLALALLATGSAWWRLDQSYVVPNHLARLVPEDTQIPVTLRLTVLTDPITQPRPPELSPFTSAQFTTRFAADIRAVQINNTWQPASGTTEVLILDSVLLTRGDTAEIVAMISRPRPPTNPGSFDYKSFLQRSAIYLSLRAKSATALTITAQPPTPTLANALTSFQQSLRAKLLQYTVIQDLDAAQTLVALLFGWHSPGMQDITRSFTDAGAAHLLAISGTHVAVIAAAVWFTLGLFIRRPAHRTLLFIAAIALYVLATPMGPPVLRAAIAVLFVALAKLGGRRPRPLNIIAATVLVVLLLNPADLLDAGFQLTFASTLCLIVLAPRVYRYLITLLMPAPWQTGLQEGRLPKLGIWLLRLLAATLSANLVGAIASAPLVAYHFHQANPWAILTGIILLPVISLVIIAALLQTLASFIGLGSALATPVLWLTHHALSLVTLLAHLPAACPGIRPPPIWLIALFFALILVWTLRHRLKLPRATLLIFALSLLATSLTWYTTTQRHDALHLWSLDVGQGSCILIETPTGQHLLINAGSASRADLTAKVLEPFLKIQGINHLDAAILTEATRNQGNALTSLLTRYPTQNLFCSALDIRHSDYWWINAMLGSLRQTGAAPRPLASVDEFTIGDLHCQTLWPPPTGDFHLHGLTLLLTCSGERILILGSNQLPVLALTPPLDPVDLIIITTNTAPSPELLAAIPLRPNALIIAPGSIYPTQSGCLHLTADSSSTPFKIEP